MLVIINASFEKTLAISNGPGQYTPIVNEDISDIINLLSACINKNQVAINAMNAVPLPLPQNILQELVTMKTTLEEIGVIYRSLLKQAQMLNQLSELEINEAIADFINSMSKFQQTFTADRVRAIIQAIPSLGKPIQDMLFVFYKLIERGNAFLTLFSYIPGLGGLLKITLPFLNLLSSILGTVQKLLLEILNLLGLTDDNGLLGVNGLLGGLVGGLLG